MPESIKRAHKRIEVIDIIKCLTIFAVVCGHTALNEELTGSNPPLIYMVIYSFHMPLFFFLAGLSASTSSLHTWPEWRLFLRKNILTLLVPYLVWSLIYCQFSFSSVGLILYGSWQALGQAGTLTSLWYLTSFFVAKIYVALVVNLMTKLKVSEKLIWYLAPAAVFFLIALLLPKISAGYPFCMDNAFAGAAFMLMGIALKDSLIQFSVQKEKVLLGTLAAAVCLYALIVALLGDGFTMNMMCNSTYGQPVPAFLLAVLGGMVFISISALLKRASDEWNTRFNTRLIAYIGQHTMGVFLLHKPMMQQLIIPTLRSLFGTFLPESLIRFFGAGLAFLFAVLLCRIIEYYVP